MVVGLTGTLTFLFTDIEGSTRRWESDAKDMQAALQAHDQVLRSVVEAHGGSLFKHTGDGVCVAFRSAQSAIDAAIEAQRCLALPVRMGLASGEAQTRDGDYFGPTLNRAARVMAAGHGGQILVATSTAELVSGVDLLTLGEHRLRDISDAVGLFQVRADGLSSVFPALRTVDAEKGNLPIEATSFVGREADVKELSELVRAHRLITLTGVGGVGKTRLAQRVAIELLNEFPGGVWLIELASVTDPTSVPNAIATSLGVTSQAGRGLTESIAEALSGRHLLIILDNCEHVLEASADVLETVLARSETVKVLATSREGLRIDAEHLWPVAALDVEAGASSEAVELFVDRAQAVTPSFQLDDKAETAAVIEICRRLDGIALAIELAAARMTSMSAREVRDRLDDRFRLLSGSGRGMEHHQTLRQAVQWSHDLLDDDERSLLASMSVFADGFDLAAATYVWAVDDSSDEFVVLDLLDSLVRKSLVTSERVFGRSRYGMLETIRQFASEQLTAAETDGPARRRHAKYFADEAVAMWEIWNGPDQPEALDWVDIEFPNLRTGFLWAAKNNDLACAVAIAAHTSMLAFALQRFEPVGWAEEVLEAATTAHLPQLPRLLTAASICAITGRPDVAIGYAEAAGALAADPLYDPFETGWSSFWEAIGHRYDGQIDRWFEISDGLAAQTGLARTIGLACLLTLLPGAGRAEEARAMADEATAAARATGNPFWMIFSMTGYGRAHADSDPGLALETMRQCLDDAQSHRLSYLEATVLREIAALEQKNGELGEALELFDVAVESFHDAGNHGSVASALADLAILLDSLDQWDAAAVVYGISRRSGISMVVNLPAALEHLRAKLGAAKFNKLVEEGASMDFNPAMVRAREEIERARLALNELKPGNVS